MRRVEREITVAAALEDVWRVLSDDALRRDWLECDVEPEEVDEGRRLAYRWERDGLGESHVELTVEAVSGGTRVRVVETAALPVGDWGTRLSALASASALALA
jgi:uncharacterized protein YndB with AHSA1/START domain